MDVVGRQEAKKPASTGENGLFLVPYGTSEDVPELIFGGVGGIRTLDAGFAHILP
jgi:hypothetical protein